MIQIVKLDSKSNRILKIFLSYVKPLLPFYNYVKVTFLYFDINA